MNIRKLAFAFDFDGVFIQGKHTLPYAKRTLQRLQKLSIPFIILTNGGGITEALKAKQISDRLGTSIDERQLCLSHTPMKSLAEIYKDKLMLIVGPEPCKAVAKSYGFKHVMSPLDIHDHHPDIWPFRRVPDEKESKCLSNLKFGGVLQFHDSLDWGLDLQVMLDVLTSKDGNLMQNVGKQTLPVYFSNSDLVWKSSYHSNRFAQGSFRHAFKALFKESTGAELVYKTYGKPSFDTYSFANQMLGPGLDVWMVGDNPASDIRGAREYGWKSVLVRTGVWDEKRDGTGHGATLVEDNVETAVERVLSNYA